MMYKNILLTIILSISSISLFAQKPRMSKEENLSEAEYNKIVDEIIKARISCDQLDLEYLHKYQKFLSSKQIFNIQRAEMWFHRELLKPHRKK